MTTSCEIYGLRVRQARLMRRLTATAVLDAVGWKGARLTRLERSETALVTSDELAGLARVLRFPEEFFRTAPVSRVSPEDLSFRAPKSTTATEKNRMAQFMALSGDFLAELDQRHKLPPVRLSTGGVTAGDHVAAATHARQCLGVKTDEPIGNLTLLLERGGIPVLLRSERFGAHAPEAGTRGRLEKHLGCSTWVGEFSERPLVVMRELDSWERTRWTLAHELGHLMLHANVGDMTEAHELEASRFASEFLAPFSVVAPGLRGSPSLLNLLPIKEKWGISLGALLRHFYDSGGMDTDRYEMLRTQLYTRINAETGFTWGRTEPGWQDRKPERPGLLSRWIEFAFGIASPEVLAAHRLIWPPDVIAEFLVGQRFPTAGPEPTRSGPPRSGGSGGVIDFAAHRARRQA